MIPVLMILCGACGAVFFALGLWHALAFRQFRGDSLARMEARALQLAAAAARAFRREPAAKSLPSRPSQRT
jgi:hypothetical protein